MAEVRGTRTTNPLGRCPGCGEWLELIPPSEGEPVSEGDVAQCEACDAKFMVTAAVLAGRRWLEK